MEDIAIGIDLGTTYSCVAVCYNNNKVHIIENEFGHNTTPSYVSIEEDGEVNVGKVPKEKAYQNPAQTIFNVKRLIGLRFSHPNVQEDIKTWPYSVIDDNGKPKIMVHKHSYHPEEISAKVLSHLKKRAEEYLRCDVTKAVITVPAYFNDQQRQATKAAGEIANLDVLCILNEPTAAAIAYCHQNGPQDQKKLNLVFDLGGGTFDVALLSVENSKVEIKAVGGDTHLGGEDFDLVLMEYCIDEIDKHYHVNFRDDLLSSDPMVKKRAEKDKRRLKNMCEEEKKNLSSVKQTVINFDFFAGTPDVSIKIRQESFNEITDHLFQKCIKIVEELLIENNIQKEDIDEVILVGGSSKIPQIQKLVKACMKKNHLSQSIKGDEAVAYGAAVKAWLMTKNRQDDSDDNNAGGTEIVVKDVVPLSIGIEATRPVTEDFYFDKIIPKHTPVPCSRKKTFYTRYAGHKPEIIVRQGECPDFKRNTELGRFKTVNLPDSSPANEPVTVTMKVNENGILEVFASYNSTFLTDDFVLEDQRRLRLTPVEINALKLENLVIALD